MIVLSNINICFYGTLFISISHGTVIWSIEVHMYIFCVLWVNGAVFKGGEEDKIQVEIYIYIYLYM